MLYGGGSRVDQQLHFDMYGRESVCPDSGQFYELFPRPGLYYAYSMRRVPVQTAAAVGMCIQNLREKKKRVVQCTRGHKQEIFFNSVDITLFYY